MAISDPSSKSYGAAMRTSASERQAVLKHDATTVVGSLAWATAQLAKSTTAALDSQLLLGHVLHKERSWLIGHPESTLTKDEQFEFETLIRRRAGGEPVAHLRGFVDWWDLRLEVSADTLIPRPETEVLVEAAIEVARAMKAQMIADVGTGSGAIAIALARALQKVQVEALDVSPAALAVAARNVGAYSLADRVQLKVGSLVEPLEVEPDLIVANLPYLSEEMMDALERDVRAEPRLALFGGTGGTEIYG